ncbi:MAG: ABC transporter substrate-binding protein [Acidimicrobiia bacterium]|nr:ABC transporter substrate-binding protein [Acidimicrobiia bacterium]
MVRGTRPAVLLGVIALMSVLAAPTAAQQGALEIGIDIQPGGFPNSLNINGRGLIPVAILGSESLDVTQVDETTLDFAGLEVKANGKGNPQCSFVDVSGDFTDPVGAPDGYVDLVCHFVDDPDRWSAAPGSATVIGSLLPEHGGTTFTGSDGYRLVPIGRVEAPIRIGFNGDLSGPFASPMTRILDGQTAFWEIVNDNGGIAGRQVELVIRDSAYDVSTQLLNYEELSSQGPDGVLMFSHSTGAPPTTATADLLVEDDLIAIPLSWYSSWADPGFGANIMELQTNYCIEAINGVSYLADAHDADTIAILSVPSVNYGEDGAQGARIAAAALGLTVVYDGEVGSIGTDIADVIAALVNTDPDIVWATITPGTLTEVLGGSYTQGLRAQWSGNSPTWNTELLDTDLGPVADEVYTHSTYTALWGTDDSPGMTDMIDGMRNKRPNAPISDLYVRSWTEGYATQQLLEFAAAQGDLTRPGLVAALRDVTVDFNGLAPNQTWGDQPDDHVVRESYIYDIDISKFTPGATVSDAGAGTGVTLLEGPYVSDVAAGFTFDGSCSGGP